jgi:hypothetical protein
VCRWQHHHAACVHRTSCAHVVPGLTRTYASSRPNLPEDSLLAACVFFTYILNQRV